VYVIRALFVSICFVCAAALLSAAAPRVLVCYGDSITAGYGLNPGEAYTDALQKALDAQGYHWKVVNRGTSGATTKDAVASLQSVLNLHPEVVVVEFGGNDGLRGLPLDVTRRNLDQVLTTLETAHIKVLLAGITLPPNYGPDYIEPFQQIFRTLAAKHHTAFVPMLYKDIVHVPGTIQPDGIHPTAKGAKIVAGTLLPVLKPLLREPLAKFVERHYLSCGDRQL
jgi:acyl-CoA thioesterase-1